MPHAMIATPISYILYDNVDRREQTLEKGVRRWHNQFILKDLGLALPPKHVSQPITGGQSGQYSTGNVLFQNHPLLGGPWHVRVFYVKLRANVRRTDCSTNIIV